jgi:hypothetical protein
MLLADGISPPIANNGLRRSQDISRLARPFSLVKPALAPRDKSPRQHQSERLVPTAATESALESQRLWQTLTPQALSEPVILTLSVSRKHPAGAG